MEYYTSITETARTAVVTAITTVIKAITAMGEIPARHQESKTILATCGITAVITARPAVRTAIKYSSSYNSYMDEILARH